MKHKKIEKLITQAQDAMKGSTDPIHGLSHVKRVIKNAENICIDMNITGRQKEALILATYWHDVSRTITKYPSIFWMVFLDDLISAFMLLKSCLKLWLFGYVPSTAIKIIFCKSIGTGRLLTKILLRKKDQILLDILKDADMLDVMHTERIENIMPMGELSKIYLFSYKRLVNYNLKLKHINFKTKTAVKQFEKIIKQLIDFLLRPEIIAWHIQQFGRKWCGEVNKKLNNLLDYITLLNLQTC
ncbi:MAG: HD domain-containing protein [Candidatus Magasanikbacteria bacterium]